jgi:hypothetical protein
MIDFNRLVVYTSSEYDNSVKPWQFDIEKFNFDVNLKTEIEIGNGILNLYPLVSMAIYIPYSNSDPI